MKRQNLLESFLAAFQGIAYAVRQERNMRIHLAAGLLAIALSLYFQVEKWEFMFVLAAVFLVLITEMINTSLEKVVDLSTRTYNNLARTVKNVAAGAVFCAAVFALFVAWLVFWDRFLSLW